jgi:hypothetical protein
MGVIYQWLDNDGWLGPGQTTLRCSEVASADCSWNEATNTLNCDGINNNEITPYQVRGRRNKMTLLNRNKNRIRKRIGLNVITDNHTRVSILVSNTSKFSKPIPKTNFPTQISIPISNLPRSSTA